MRLFLQFSNTVCDAGYFHLHHDDDSSHPSQNCISYLSKKDDFKSDTYQRRKIGLKYFSRVIFFDLENILQHLEVPSFLQQRLPTTTVCRYENAQREISASLFLCLFVQSYYQDKWLYTKNHTVIQDKKVTRQLNSILFNESKSMFYPLLLGQNPCFTPYFQVKNLF